MTEHPYLHVTHLLSTGEPVHWISLSYSDLCSVAEMADRYGRIDILKRVRSAIKRRDEDSRPTADKTDPGYSRVRLTPASS